MQTLVPEIQESDVVADGSGVRAQALRPNGALVDDFQFVSSENAIQVLNVPSPAATASLPIGREIARLAGQDFNLA
jgi:L-2-hydroxyglutarate oxidase